MQDKTIADLFPLPQLPADAGVARLAGLYAQRQQGLYMQRIKILAGELTAAQWRAISSLAQGVSPGTPLHLTTRQDIEFHDVPVAEIGRLQRGLADAGLTGAGACGDTLRNVTVSPTSGTLDGTVDLRPLARQIRALLEGTAGIFALPRKFKICLSESPAADAQPWIHDLGLIAVRDPDRGWGFTVIVGGSLGVVPATGIVLTDFLPAADVLPLAVGAVEVFATHGDRENRRKARLRHVRQRLGDEAFKTLLTDALVRAKSTRTFEPVEMPLAQTGFTATTTLNFANGNVFPAAAGALADLIDGCGLAVRLVNQHRVLIIGPDRPAIEQALSAHAPLADAARAAVAVVACPGTRWCARALTDTNAVAETIDRTFANRLPEGTTVCISGCPNGCAHTAVAHVGLSGAQVTVDEQKQERYSLFFDGQMGTGPALAASAGRKLSVEEVLSAIREHFHLDA